MMSAPANMDSLKPVETVIVPRARDLGGFGGINGQADERVFLIFGLPIIPQRECPIVPCSLKISLRNTPSTMSIEKNGTPVRRLRSKSRPFVVSPELAIPTLFRESLLSIFHVISS